MSIFSKIFEWFSHASECEADPACIEVTIKKNDTLSALAEHFTGDANRWPEFDAANPGRGYDKPDTLLHPGDQVRVPKSWGGD